MRATCLWSTGLLLTLTTLVASAATIGRPAAQREPELWIHLESIGASRVHLNLPIASIEAFVALAPDAVFQDWYPRLVRDVPVADIRGTWRARGDVSGAEFVPIRHRGRVWRIAREGNTILVDISDRHWYGSEDVRVEISGAVADALLSGAGDTLNARAALRELSTRRGEMIRIIGANSNTRIWIDESRAQ